MPKWFNSLGYMFVFFQWPPIASLCV